MPEEEKQLPHEQGLRAVEAEFQARPDHKSVEAAPALITMPDAVVFEQMAAAREAQEKAERERHAEELKQWHERMKRERRNGRIKKALAVTAVFMTIKSGGVVDRIGDQFSDAGAVVADAVAEPQPGDYLLVKPGEEIDGTPYEEYPAAAREGWQAEAEAEAEAVGDARDTVIELFDHVDKDGYGGIKDEVEAYRGAHPELFVDDARVKKTLEAIDDAGTNKDVVENLGEFMSFYGMKVGFHDDEVFKDRSGRVKEIARAFVESFSVLPRDFIALSEVERLTISNEPISNGSVVRGSEMGSYSHSDNTINIVAMSGLMNIAAPIEGFLQRSDFSYEGIIAHELGHALDEKLHIPVYLPDGEELGDELSPAVLVEHVGRGMINRPEVPSLYAKTSHGEYSAELLSGVLSDRSDGLAKTEEWRKFGSKSNKAMLATLVALEKNYPGIAKILVANRA